MVDWAGDLLSWEHEREGEGERCSDFGRWEARSAPMVLRLCEFIVESLPSPSVIRDDESIALPWRGYSISACGRRSWVLRWQMEMLHTMGSPAVGSMS